VFSTIVSETLRTLNVLPDANIKQMVSDDAKRPVENQVTGLKAQQVVLKR